MKRLQEAAAGAAFLTIVIGPGPAAAQPIFDRLAGGTTCYLRLYDAQHMRRIPKQTVSKFSVIAAAPDPSKARHPREFTVRFGFWLKNAGAYDAEAVCKTTGSGANCLVEGDGGGFSLAMQGSQLKVTLGPRLSVEGSKGFSPNIAIDENRVMLLSTAHKDSCRRGD